MRVEAREQLGDIETVCVKEAVSHKAVPCCAVQRARELVREGARRSLAQIEGTEPFVVDSPVRTEITFNNPSYADNLSALPFIERMDGRTVSFAADDYLQAFEMFSPLHYLAGFPHS
ncbi:MAG: M55 family metallopeptidase [Armatimonadota bacterium]